MTPQVLATIQANFFGYDRQRALGFFGATLGSGTVAGQLLGGVLVQADLFGLAWRPVFLLNVPLGLAGLAASRLVPQTRAATPVPVDRRGAVLLAAAILLLLVPVSVGREQGWPAWCWAMLAGAPVIAAVFWRDQRRAERAGRAPLLPPSLLGLPGFRRGLCAVLLFFPYFGGFMLVTAVTLQDGRGFSPLTAGLSLVPLALAFLVLSLCARRIVGRFGRRAIVASAGVLTAGLLLFAIQVQRGYDHLSALNLAPAMALIGAGSAGVMVPLFATVLAAVPGSVAGAASGVLTTTQQAGLALGASAIGSLFFTLVDRYGWRAATVVSLLAAAGLAAATMVATARISIFHSCDKPHASATVQ
jgi:MFS family permease